MGRLLPYLVFLLSTPAAASFNCPEGEGSSISVIQCYGAGSSHNWPAGSCPTGQILPLPVAIALVNSTFPDGATCTQSGYTVSGPVQFNETATNWSAFKRCRNSSGANGTASPAVLGTKQCSEGAACQYDPGTQLPANVLSGVDGTDFQATYCFRSCRVQPALSPLSISAAAASGQPYTPIYGLVLSGECEPENTFVVAPTQSNDCTEIAGQIVCTQPGQSMSATLNDLELDTTVDGTLCTPGGCLADQFNPSSPAQSFYYDPPSRGAIATTDTPSPPAPDSGTEGQAAAPTLTISTTTAGGQPGNTYNYWSPAVISGSTTNPGGGTGPGNGGDGTGQTCGGPGQPACKVELEGDFTAPSNPEEDGVPTFRESVSNFLERVQNSPIGSAAQNVAAHVPEGGQPPEITFSLSALGDREFTLRIPDPVRQQVETVLPLIMTAVWALIAIRLFLEA